MAPAFAAPTALRVRAAPRRAPATTSPRAAADSPGGSARAARGRARLNATRLGDAALAAEAVLPVGESPALAHRAKKYLFPMRADNTQVFFDQGISEERTLMVVFADAHHGMYLDVVSVLKALGVKCWRIAGRWNDVARVVMERMEGELVSMEGLGLSLDNCVAFWISDEETGEKISDDVERLDQIQECIKMELSAPNCRPTPATPSAWHRVTVELDRAGLYSVFSVQTTDRKALLTELTGAFTTANASVASAAIETLSDRVENTFFVRTPEGRPLTKDEVAVAIEEIMRALLRVGDAKKGDTLWYQQRDGGAVVVAEALFIDHVCNKTLATFAKVETPNFRGRLPGAPYRPVSLQ